MSDQRVNKTGPTDVPVEEYLGTVSETRRAEAEILIEMMQRISGEPPVMWGPSIIGFGKTHYRYDTGREGDMGLLGFSPRKATLSVYFNEGFDVHSQDLNRLGKHKIGVSCLYINKLSDVDLSVLEHMLSVSLDLQKTPAPASRGTPDDYQRSVPLAAQAQFAALRALVKGLLPQAEEVVSYGILGYKVDKRRARVYISGFADHVAIYPLPQDEALAERIKPHVRGKGTIHFPLNEPLPEGLITDIVHALTR